MELDLDNKEWQDALQIVNFTRRSLFLTGKAGTGKSTFLRYVAKNTKKKHVILAPTGIAAINAGGSTLHSFFRLPFHPLLPNDRQYDRKHIRETLKYTNAQRKLLREVELIIVDEISMVRADIIDFIDKVLRIYTRNYEPFGGKQLLLVGDIYQLEPVLKEEDRQLLSPFYSSAYFFNAKVWQQMQLVSIELRKVYRQRDDNFIAGLSMGGRGTIKFAVNYPEKFAAAATLSAAPVNFADLGHGTKKAFLDLDEPRLKATIENAGGLEAYIHSEENVWQILEDAVRQNGQDKLPRLLFACGEDDALIYSNFKDFKAYFEKIGLAAEWFTAPGYKHEWRFWDLAIQKALVFFGL